MDSDTDNSSIDNDTVVDLLIIGGGPTGLFAAFYAGLRSMSVRIVDSLALLGGQLSTLYPEKYIFDVAGFPKILAKDLVEQLVEQAMYYKPQVCLDEQVQSLDRDESAGHFLVSTSKSTHRARTVLIAAGVGAFQPRKVSIPGADYFEDKGLAYFVSDTTVFRDQRVLVVGGGDSAVDWSNTLAPITQKLWLIHRNDRFRAHPASVDQLKAGSTNIHLWHELRAIEGNSRVERAVIYDNRSKSEQTLEVDAVLVNIGFINSLGPLANWGLEMQGGQIQVDSQMQTSRPGIFAAGDITAHSAKLKLIATGFGEAVIAVNFAAHYLNPKANVFPGHSSNLR
ncbi:MAG: NAD(P)/FAD-dependent oxidoreductase [Phycisphaerales bacterium]|nr:NAD(P)/FAD-dependent oxidoreductase [Phycisphaerales bacterium]